MRFLSAALLFLILCQCDLSAQVPKHTFALGDRDFLLDGKPFQIIAGEMHFARIPRQVLAPSASNGKGYGIEYDCDLCLLELSRTIARQVRLRDRES